MDGKKLKHIIVSFKTNKVFCINDLNHSSNYQNIKRQINRLVKKNYIQQVVRGVYYKPTISNALNGMTSLPSIDDVAKVLARKNGWRIVKSGAHLLNYMGLSLQTPYRYVYASTGPYKTYKINNRLLIFKHVRSGDLVNHDNNTATLIQMIKTIGKNNINKRQILSISKIYSKNDKQRIRKSNLSLPIWINQTIMDICKN